MKTKLHNCSRLLIICLLFFPFAFSLQAQQVAKSFTAADGTFLGFYEFKPSTYNDNPTKKYPLIIFLHGIGERGNGTTELYTLNGFGLPRLLSQGATMTFTNPNTGVQETFLVLSPQLPKWKGGWENVYVEEMLNYAKANLRVDTNKLFLTGLSLGGGGVWQYANTSVANSAKFAAIAPICGVCAYTYGTLCTTIGTANIGVWGFTNADDNIVNAACTIQACDVLAQCNPTKVRKTVYPNGGHDSWTKAYDTGHTIQTGTNLYEWFLSNSKTTISPVPNQAPVANAGNNVTITLPVNTVTLSGTASSDADGTIATYSWTKQSGPTAFNIVTAAGASTVVNNLTEGVYSFKLTVTDNKGASSSANVQVTVNAAPLPQNQYPVANAGAAINITLPVNSTTLNGAASSDPDGTISSYNWSKISGPAPFNIVSPSAATSALNNLIEGTYTFKLLITDNNGATASATVQVTVNAALPPPNQQPVANAGTAINITLPVNSTTLDGSGSADPDGTVSTYSWTKVSGPTSFNIVNPSAASTILNNLVEGIYIFKLAITDNNGASASATVQVTVNAAPNQPPVANAGMAISITLPVNATNLNGNNSSDPDGTISSYSWTKVSGPAQYNMATPLAVSTVLNNLVEGVYSFKLTVTDNKGATASSTVQVTVNAATPVPNQAPVANAGNAIVITLPVNSTNLNGNNSSDPDGTISSYSWTKVSGPAQFNIINPAAVSTGLNNLLEGIYSFKLTVTDNKGATASATVQVTVHAATPVPNQAPVANAGNAMVITLPVNSITLNGVNSADADGSIVSYNWSKISGPVGFTIATPAAVSTAVNNLTEGIYVFQLTVTDDKGAAASSNVQVTVNAPVPPANKAPVAHAGNNISITLPVNNVSLNGSLSADPDGSISTFNWVKVSGPAQFNIVNASAASTAVNNLVEGIYSFKLTVTDDKGLSASATAQVTVIAAAPPVNKAPIANAGADRNVIYPAGVITLDGSASTDTDGQIAAYNWKMISGPTTGIISNGTTSKASVGGLLIGEYIFELTVTDNRGVSATDNVKISIVNNQNKRPKANAGKDTSLVLPGSSMTLNGAASADPDGAISSYSWRQLSGPADAVFTSRVTSVVQVSQLVEGEYVFVLTVADDRGLTSADTVNLMVINNFRVTQYFNLYPNPVRNILNVRYIHDKSGVVYLTILNKDGTAVRRMKIEKNGMMMDVQVDVSNLKVGFYYLELKFDDGKTAIKQFLKR